MVTALGSNIVVPLGIISKIEEVHDICVLPLAPLEGRGGRLGFSQLVGDAGQYMDGYKVFTDQHEIAVLISNGQSCCESWGYLASNSDDDLSQYTGAILESVNLTDVALNKEIVEASGYYEGYQGGIQFVDFVTSMGTFQLAVYNAHNGYYGHGIAIAIDEKLLLNDTL